MPNKWGMEREGGGVEINWREGGLHIFVKFNKRGGGGQNKRGSRNFKKSVYIGNE